MNSQLTAIVVAVVAVTAVSGGAVIVAEPNAGADDATTDDEAAAAIQASTSTPQSSQANEQSADPSTETDGASDTSTDDADTTTEQTDESSETERTNETAEANETDDATGTNDSSTVTDGESPDVVNEPPMADAGPNETVREWVRVTLDASASADAEGDVSYEWQQVDGPAVALHDETTATPNFLAPDVSDRTNLTFEVTVTDEDGATATDTVTVTVRLPKIDHDTPLADELDAADADSSADDELPASEGGASGGSDSGDASSPDDGDAGSAETTRDDIATAKYGTAFDGLSAERAGVVEELYLRHSADEWNVSEVKTRDELAQEAYDADYDELGFDARVDVQETFDAQFGDTGGEVSKNDISQSMWETDFQNLSSESAGHVTELYDRQPLADDKEHFRTRQRWAYLLHDAPLDDLTPEERVEVEQAYHDQFAG